MTLKLCGDEPIGSRVTFSELIGTREAIVETTSKSRTIAQRRRSSLNWIDFLVIAAIILTFAAIVTTTLGRARASTYNYSPDVSTNVSQAPFDASLIKARIRLASGGPWL
jgi:hypothetical protein